MPKGEQHIVVHAGFHKTGTTSAQGFLTSNGPKLWPHMAIVTPDRIRSVARFATIYSRLEDPVSLTEFEFRLKTFLQTLDIGKKRHLCISEENLAGLMPGRNGQIDYASCPALMVSIKRVIRSVFGPERKLSFYFSTRDSQAWLRSNYWHNLRASKLELGFDDYADIHHKAADFDTVLRATQSALGKTPVYTSRLEDVADHPYGPAAPILALIPLDPDVLTDLAPSQPRNAAPNVTDLDAVLALNREADDDGWQTRKDALLASLGTSGD